MSASLPYELNTFYVRFDKNNFPAQEVQKAQDPMPTSNIQDRCVEILQVD